MLFVPGGFGTRTLKEDAAFVDWLKTARLTPLKVSVCTGALLLGAAGYLAGEEARNRIAAAMDYPYRSMAE